jgi:hypothetical protein
MAVQTVRVRNFHAAENERAVAGKAMNVVTDTGELHEEVSGRKQQQEQRI